MEIPEGYLSDEKILKLAQWAKEREAVMRLAYRIETEGLLDKDLPYDNPAFYDLTASFQSPRSKAVYTIRISGDHRRFDISEEHPTRGIISASTYKREIDISPDNLKLSEFRRFLKRVISNAVEKNKLSP